MPAHRSKEEETQNISATADRRPHAYHEEQVESEHQVLDSLRRQAQLCRRHCRRTCWLWLRHTRFSLFPSLSLSLVQNSFTNRRILLLKASRERYCATREQWKTQRKKTLDARTRVPTSGADVYVYREQDTRMRYHHLQLSCSTAYVRVRIGGDRSKSRFKAVIRSKYIRRWRQGVGLTHTHTPVADPWDRGYETQDFSIFYEYIWGISQQVRTR